MAHGAHPHRPLQEALLSAAGPTNRTTWHHGKVSVLPIRVVTGRRYHRILSQLHFRVPLPSLLRCRNVPYQHYPDYGAPTVNVALMSSSLHAAPTPSSGMYTFTTSPSSANA